MTLDEYLTRGGITGADFAATVGLTEASVSRIRNGQQNFSRDVMRRIIAASGGVVTAAGLVDDRLMQRDNDGSHAASPGKTDHLTAEAAS